MTRSHFAINRGTFFLICSRYQRSSTSRFFIKSFQFRCIALDPFTQQTVHLLVERRELSITENSLLDLRQRHRKLRIVFAQRLEQLPPHRGNDLPVTLERVDVAIRNAAQMPIDVLNVFRLAAIDVAWQIQTVIMRIFKILGAEGGTRTPTSFLTRPSNVRVCQFRHFGKRMRSFQRSRAL